MDQIVKKAEEALKRSQFGALAHVMALWRGVHWKQVKGQIVSGAAQVNSKEKDTINLYPALSRLQEQAGIYAILREFGNLIFKRGNAATRQKWELKLCLPQKEQIDSFQSRLKGGGFKSYRAVVDSFTTSMDKLVALNLANAMIANNVPFSGAFNIDVHRWGATHDYASQNRMHSIKPLVHAYADPEIGECFGKAFAATVVNDLRSVREKSVAEALKGILLAITNTTR